MASVALTLRVLADTAQASAELRNLGDSADSMGDRLGKVAAVAAGFAAVTGAVMKAAQAASALEQASGGVEAVFKSGSGAVKQWADQAATSIGLSKAQYMELATLIGSQLKNAGVSMDDLGSSTNNLIQQGADLAAMFGGTTAEAVDAISAALKGERDPIEKYGITLTEAAVNAEIMAEGLDTSTAAALQNAKAVATMALITKQGSDAWGAAAREADTFAAQQQVLQAVFENTMASLGSVFLPALADLAGAFSDLMPVIGAVLSPLAGLLSAVLQLPAPILAIGVAFAAWTLVGPKITTMLSGVSSSFATFYMNAKLLQSGANMGDQAAMRLGQSMSTMGAVARTAGAGMANVGKSLLAAVGGPVGLAVMAGITLITFGLSKLAESGARAKEMAQNVQSAMTSMQEAVKKGGEETARAAALSALKMAEWGKSSTNLTDYSSRLGVQLSTLVDGMTGVSGAADSVEAAYQAQRAALVANIQATTNWSDGVGYTDAQMEEQLRILDEMHSAYQPYVNMSGQAADANAKEAAAIQGTAGAAQQSAAALAEQAAAQAKAATEAAGVAAEQTAVSAAMREAEAATQAAARAADAFGLAMDQLAGRNITAEQAAAGLNDSMRGLSEAFAGAADKGGYSMDALVSWNVAALTSTEAGASLYGALNDVRSGYDTSVAAAYSQAAATGDAAAAMAAGRAAADAAYASFIQMATAAGLSGDQAAALAAKLGIVAGTAIPDKTFELIAQDQQAQAAVTTAQQATIDAKTFDVNAIISPAQGALTSLTGMPLANTVKVDANTGQATGTIQNLTGTKYQTTVQTNADTSAAQSTVNGFTAAQRSTQVAVQANTTAAQEAITALVNQRRTLTITVDANVGPAQSAINGIQGKTVTVTVNTQQNITQTVTTVPAPASASLAAPQDAAAPALSPTALAAESAPPPMRNLARQQATTDTQGGGGTTYVINVSGGLDSADGIARRIESVLRQRERRQYGITVGRVPTT